MNARATLSIGRSVKMGAERCVYFLGPSSILVQPVCISSRDSSVGIPTRLLTGRPMSRGSIPSKGNFLFSIMSRPALGPANPPVQWVPGDVSTGVKRQGREADHSLSSGVEVKKGGVAPPHPLKSP
jgi:hypothetical protein